MDQNNKEVAQNSWGKIANWYNKNLQSGDTFQAMVIKPNLERLVNIGHEEVMIDLACGQGYFCQVFENNCKLIGIDISKELLTIADKKCRKTYFIASSAENINNLKLPKVDRFLTVLALQNIADPLKTIRNIANILKKNPSGTNKWHLVINHPYYRQIGSSEWEFDLKAMKQRRVITKYMTPYVSKILANPSKIDSEKTLTYHHPLQDILNFAFSSGFALTGMEEWISHRPQDQGIRTNALEIARNEIPMFMYLEFSIK